MSQPSFSSSRGDSIDFDNDLTLSDRLKIFKATHFDPDAYVSSRCRNITEKEIRNLCGHLVDLKAASAEEMRKSVYANYSDFIRTSKEISDLEGELLSLRNLLSTQGALIHTLADGFRVESLAVDEGLGSKSSSRSTQPMKMEEERLVEFVDTLEVLLAERRVDEALDALDEGESFQLTPTSSCSLHAAIREHRRKLADQLARTTCQSSITNSELRSAVTAMKRLGDSPRAHTLLLNSHEQNLQRGVKSLRLPSGTHGGMYTASLSQLVFSVIDQAVTDSLELFTEDPSFSSELVTWTVRQAEGFAVLVKRHALAPTVASGGLRVAVECVGISMKHCLSLQERGLVLTPVLLRFFKPCVELALAASFKRIEQCTAALAGVDDWSLPSTRATKLCSSAHGFNSMVQEMFEDVVILESLQLVDAALHGILQAFGSYITMMITALPGSMETETISNARIVRTAETEAQQIGLLASAFLLADELLPRVTVKLTSFNQNDARKQHLAWKRRLQRSVDQLRDSFCRQHALVLIFNEDGMTRLSAYTYLCMDESTEEPEWFPSLIFQELLAQLARLESIVMDLFVGRERFATVLLTRLVETVILWLSDDQSFWQEIEDGQGAFGPFGLRQFYLDMEFVMLFCSQGNYLSRNLHRVIKSIIAKALDSVTASGIDPYSLLPEDDWFADVAQIAMKMLSGKTGFGNVDKEILSPTASTSARSISSAVSRGSI